jgi:hypothetical protein
MNLLCCCHRCHCWRHICLHSWDNGAKDDRRSIDKAIMLISAAGKRWNTMTPLVWSNKNKNKNNNKINYSGGNVTASAPADS